jgi:glycine cleavage system transcriptional repressor
MRHYALSAIGRNRPGIVAEVSAVLLAHSLNVEDSQMTILGGHFAMMAIVADPNGTDRRRLAAELDEASVRLGLEALSLRDLGGSDLPAPEASHIVTVYGLDHPGIVHAVSAALERSGVDITDLNTRLVSEDGERLYVLMMELALPAGLTPAELEETLAEAGRGQGVDVTLRALEGA